MKEHDGSNHLRLRPAQADARSILAHALERVLPEAALRRYVSLDEACNVLTVAGRTYDLGRFERIIVVGGGKAARRTAAELVRILGGRISAGALNVYRDQAREPIAEHVELFAADHPIPNEEGARGARRMIELLRAADARTLVIALISGGGSSLMALPVEGVSLQDYQDVSSLLLTVPATIDEINAVRKHIDPLKGGGMRKYAAGAGAFISLVLSDVPVTKTGVVDDPSVIASGPTVGDASTFEAAKRALTGHGIWSKTPRAVREYIEANLGREEHETLHSDSPLLAAERSQYVIIANNDEAMEAAGERAAQLGYAVRLAGCRTGSTADKIKAEVTQEIENIWRAIAPHLAAGDWVTFAAFSTDGIDGHSSLAGAIADGDTLRLAAAQGLDARDHLARYDSATFFQKLGLGIETGPSGTNVADLALVLVCNPALAPDRSPEDLSGAKANVGRRIAFIFGGEATVQVNMPEGQEPGQGGRNTHLTLLAAEKLAERGQGGGRGRAAIAKGLAEAGIPAGQIEVGEVACLGYASDVGPISLTPLAIVGVRGHADVEKAVRYAYEQGIPITARGAGSGLPAQSVGSGIVLDMRALDTAEVLGDHAEGGKIVSAQAGVICTRLNAMLKAHGAFLASFPASTDMATIGGMIANNASGASSVKLGTTKDQVLDLHVVLPDGTGLWTSEIEPGEQPWAQIIDLVRANAEAIDKGFPRVPKNSSGYDVLDILRQLEAGVPVDWSRLFAHSEGTLGVITEAKLRAMPLATQKATCIVYFTDLAEACGAIPKIYDLQPSCFDTAVTTNLELIRKTYPNLGIREDAKVMYLIEFDDVEVRPDPKDPSRRLGAVRIMEQQAAAALIAKQVAALRELLGRDYPQTAIGFDVAYDQAKADALWQGRRSALNVLYAYDPSKRPLTMIECVVIPRDQQKLLEFITYMDEVFNQEQVVAGTHGHAGDCNFHLYLLLNLTEQQDRVRLINVMARITEKVTALGGSMSGEHADGRTRGVILPHVFGKALFDLFVQIKDLLDPRGIMHPGVKIVREARDKDLHAAIEELVGVEAEDSKLTLARFQDFSALYSGVCSLCSQCADICPVFSKLADGFAARTEAAPTFRRALAMALQSGADPAMRHDPLFKKAFDLCLMCGQCTWKCATNASMRDLVVKIREPKRSRVIAPAIAGVMARRGLYTFGIGFLGFTQGLWQSRPGRAVLSWLPQGLIPTRIPKQRYLPRLARSTMESRYPELAHVPPAQADIAYFYGCTSDLFDEPIADGFINIARHNGWQVSLPPQTCCGEPFASFGNTEQYYRMARYNIDQLLPYKYVVAHCPSCILAFKELAKEFARLGDTAYEEKAKALVAKLYDPAQFIVKVIGVANLEPATQAVARTVAVHVSCHEKLGHKTTASANNTRDLLDLIPGLQVVPMAGADECCGEGGPWGLAAHYDQSLTLRQSKIANVMASGADIVTSWCLGCMIQMRDGLGQAGSAVEVRHPLELLSEAYGPAAK
ncbi:MAG TPA: DUF4147 domain-containing protein [Anaerolineae bacterium]|nr:DUF4147 domain-containing protein [Anaerolineae bacterium]HPL26942.1 DUF4147 domain-containing protein [Anaerolineae bacterium]